MNKHIKLDDAIGIITEHQGIRGDTFKALHNAYAVDIVRCRECKYWLDGSGLCKHWSKLYGSVLTKADDFCSYGERKRDE